jgi:trans-aconitate methyltransferase
MSLADEYKRQARWRDWEAVLRLLPLRAGERVLDLGCALGDQSAMLAARGAQVVGVDANAELLVQADRRAIPGASFVQADAADVSGLGLDPVDGIWSSFTAAYFPDFGPVLASWLQLLRPGGWIALVEMDDLLGHEPLTQTSRLMVDAFYEDAWRHPLGGYDFRMGSKLRSLMERQGLTILEERRLDDRELSFQGRAEPEVLQAWRDRLARMKALKDFSASRAPGFEQEFLDALSREDHVSRCRVLALVAQR